MATRDFHLVCRYQTGDEAHFKLLKDLFRQFANEVYATAALMSGSSEAKPEVKIYSDDFFEGREEFEAAEAEKAEGQGATKSG